MCKNDFCDRHGSFNTDIANYLSAEFSADVPHQDLAWWLETYRQWRASTDAQVTIKSPVFIGGILRTARQRAGQTAQSA